jgi:hypothetical protein
MSLGSTDTYSPAPVDPPGPVNGGRCAFCFERYSRERNVAIAHSASWKLTTTRLKHIQEAARAAECPHQLPTADSAVELVEMGESRTPRPEPFARDQLRACPMICRRTVGRPSAGYRPVQSRPLSGFATDYATLLRSASPLDDASTAHGDEAASTLTLLPKQRGREQAGGCQLLRFAAFLRGPTAPRLAFPDNQTLSKPRIPTGRRTRVRPTPGHARRTRILRQPLRLAKWRVPWPELRVNRSEGTVRPSARPGGRAG